MKTPARNDSEQRRCAGRCHFEPASRSAWPHELTLRARCEGAFHTVCKLCIADAAGYLFLSAVTISALVRPATAPLPNFASNARSTAIVASSNRPGCWVAITVRMSDP